MSKYGSRIMKGNHECLAGTTTTNFQLKKKKTFFAILYYNCNLNLFFKINLFFYLTCAFPHTLLMLLSRKFKLLRLYRLNYFSLLREANMVDLRVFST